MIYYLSTKRASYVGNILLHPSQYNVLIATHSLSELPMEDFLKYYLGLLDDDNPHGRMDFVLNQYF